MKSLLIAFIVSTVSPLLLASIQSFGQATKNYPLLLKQMMNIAKYTNSWTAELCSVLQDDYRRQGCMRCFFPVASPENNPHFLPNFTDCSERFLPENYNLCVNIAKGTNLSFPFGGIDLKITPQNDEARGRMVIKCLQVTGKGIKGSMCMSNMKRNSGDVLTGEMSALDVILLNKCFLEEQSRLNRISEPDGFTFVSQEKKGRQDASDEDVYDKNYQDAMINLLKVFLFPPDLGFDILKGDSNTLMLSRNALLVSKSSHYMIYREDDRPSTTRPPTSDENDKQTSPLPEKRSFFDSEEYPFSTDGRPKRCV